MGGRGKRGLKARVGRECCISGGGPDGLSSTIVLYKLVESEQEVTVLAGVGSPGEAGRAAPRVHLRCSLQE